jgi:hypothetical protein
MKAQDLIVGSTLQVEVHTTNENAELVTKQVIVSVQRCSDVYVWFKYSGLQRIGRTTIDKYPSLYRIISL